MTENFDGTDSGSLKAEKEKPRGDAPRGFSHLKGFFFIYRGMWI